VTAPVAQPLGPAELYPRFALFVRRTVARLGVRRADVDDVTHDVFVTLARKGTTFPHERAARAWLFAAARRVASNDRRARTRAAARTPGWEPVTPPPPDVAFERAEAADVVRRFAADLPGSAREVFHLSEVEGLAAPQVADALGLKLNTTYSHIRRVRQRFARAIAIGVGLLLLLLAVLTGTCAAGGSGDRVALRGAAHVAG
jgi:RNA polymerase sigma-70 factor (ECF subfamily)